MSMTLQALFNETNPSVPNGLVSRIGNAIEEERLKSARARAGLATWSALFSFCCFVWYLVTLGDSLLSSEFSQIVTLAFSDFSFVRAYSEVFLYSLAETFPVTPIVLLIAPLFLHFLSLAFRSRYASIVALYEARGLSAA